MDFSCNQNHFHKNHKLILFFLRTAFNLYLIYIIHLIHNQFFIQFLINSNKLFEVFLKMIKIIFRPCNNFTIITIIHYHNKIFKLFYIFREIKSKKWIFV